jgi:hypothetical protein
MQGRDEVRFFTDVAFGPMKSLDLASTFCLSLRDNVPQQGGMSWTSLASSGSPAD